jgi:hypothetical protein
VNGKRETQPRGNCRETSAGRGAEVEGQDLRRSCPIDRCLGSNLSPLASRVRRVDPDPWTKSRLSRKTTRYLVEGEVSDVRGRERYERGEGEKAGYRNGYRPRQREDGGRRGGIFGAASSRTRMASPSFGGKRTRMRRATLLSTGCCGHYFAGNSSESWKRRDQTGPVSGPTVGRTAL